MRLELNELVKVMNLGRSLLGLLVLLVCCIYRKQTGVKGLLQGWSGTFGCFWQSNQGILCVPQAE